ncbi:nucleoside triphosphate pyrophosphohydrolase [Nitritalea halalkaliphila LW7]|uniref:Nucleoside triphosphate pyrophosphohydrolase n=1 Tax=Nitritalea halalkaliphila LW7 TaxID=1189621 RepID=I5BVT1_9BACT|nr:nucleoside triphosphate pyrophosphohydrolase [Nitritalea halalkaliphila]EIM73683.1 nucleoside triphosphate pyrophosphohydrolase [Nitritalea halalkaliphila LW7]
MSTPAHRDAQLTAFDRLLTIMDELREQCPWDRKQTTESLRHLTIEETFELSDAILDGDPEEIKKELGDLLLHLVFYARIGSERGEYDVASIIDSLCEKLIRRHPHIYGDTAADDAEAVKQNWEKIKLAEKPQGETRSVLSGVPRSLPALIKSMRIQEKARGVGFDWEDKAQVWAKVKEELAEFEEAYQPEKGSSPESLSSENATRKGETISSKEVLLEEQKALERAESSRQQAMEAEFGDLLFSLINFSRFAEINPEEALERTNRKFIKRFQYMERQAAAAGKQIDQLSFTEMDALWEEAKRH